MSSASSSPLVLRSVEVEGRVVDVALDRGVISAVGPGLPAGEDEIDGGGGALLPGLHDHHLHLFAMAAAARSVDMAGDGLAALWAADATLPPGEWIRAVGWHESSGWELDRRALDYAVPGRPVRVQHTSGALWVLNTPALEAVGLAGHDTGRLYGCDGLLRDRLGDGSGPPALAEVGASLAAVGITGVTDATPYDSMADVDALVSAGLPQRLRVMGSPALDLTGAPAKIVVADHDPPSVEALIASVRAARARRRAVAFHCASRLGLVLALAALDEAGARPGDRIEHGAVIPDDAVPALRRLGVTVVTQPAFVAERGDRYLAEVDDDDRPFLWRCGSLLAAGIPVAASTDAPLGPADPWAAMRAAVSRTTGAGQVLGEAERVSGEMALAMFLSPLEDAGGPARRVEVGAPADVCLLHGPLAEVLSELDASLVRTTLVGGAVVP